MSPVSWRVFVQLLLSSSAVVGYPQYKNGWRARHVQQRDLKSEYDYIVVGGGQSGLVVANRLSEQSQSTVLVVEYGYFDNNPGQIEPSSATVYNKADLFNVTSLPQAGLDGLTFPVLSASVVGGGSTVNGMMLNRGAADEYNNWEKLGNPGWAFDDLLPYFIKSTKFQHPSPALAKDFNITWDPRVFGTDGPIHLSFAPFQWPGTKHQWRAFVEAGAEPQVEGAGGNAFGVFWYTSAIDNTTVTRSYARSGYYDPIQSRENLHLATGWRVNRVVFDDEKRATGVEIQQRGTPDDADFTFIGVRKEVVLAAGSLNSPIVLQRSGIGSRDLLEQAGIDILVDLPGVGGNLQDHPPSVIRFNYTKDVWPNPTNWRNNATFVEWAQQEWAEHRSGPLSQTVGNRAAYLPLKVVAPDKWSAIAEAYKAQTPSAYLPSSYHPAQTAGYELQRELLASSMMRSDNAALEYTFNGQSTFALILNKPLSRGTINLDPTNKFGEPVVDFQTMINPLDAQQLAESIRFARRLHQTSTMTETFAPQIISPAANLTTDEQLIQHIRSVTRPTAAHLSGTCAMMPQHLGGVVAPDLTVYGVTGLSVADASIMPLIPGAHTCASVYAVAEKAADLVKFRHRVDYGYD